MIKIARYSAATLAVAMGMTMVSSAAIAGCGLYTEPGAKGQPALLLQPGQCAFLFRDEEYKDAYCGDGDFEKVESRPDLNDKVRSVRSDHNDVATLYENIDLSGAKLEIKQTTAQLPPEMDNNASVVWCSDH